MALICSGMLCCSNLGTKPLGNLCGAAEGTFAGADCAPGLHLREEEGFL